MCSSPEVSQPVQKPVQYLRNPFLDGMAIGAENRGRNSLRIDRSPGIGGMQIPANAPVPRNLTTSTPATTPGVVVPKFPGLTIPSLPRIYG